jgi:Fur family ferric uptake transcriptional regulator
MVDTKLQTHELRKAGLKVTVPRVKILQILENAKPQHISAEDVYQRLSSLGEDVGLATVYRVLTQFETAGLVHRHRFDGDQALFELNEGTHHDHIMCVKCGTIEEFVDEIIEERQKAIAERLGFDITDHTLYLYGICSKCRIK